MLKKLILAAAGLALTAPAFADGWRRGPYPRYYQPRYVVHYYRPVVVVPAPRVYYAPAPVYYAAPPSLMISGRSSRFAFSLGLPL